MGGRDLVAPFVEACRAHGLKVGLYYSSPHWRHNRHRMSFRYGGKQRFPDLPDLGSRHEPIILPDRGADEQAQRDADYHAFLKDQVEELLTRYGRIDVLWFDGGPVAVTVERIRELRPGIVMNPRAHGCGDYLTPEGVFPNERPQG